MAAEKQASDLQAQDEEARRRALLCTDSVWLAASAGSGKTYALISRILALLLDGANPQRLLCLTYTRAAAAEMMERLARRLITWATDKEIREREVREIVGEDLDDEILQEKFALAGRLFFIALDSPGGIRVRTIHAWCQELLHSFPLEAGVPPDFEVLEEASAGRLRHQAKIHSLRRESDSGGANLSHEFLSRYADEKQLNRVLRAIWEGKEDRFRALLTHEAEVLQLVQEDLGWRTPTLVAPQEFNAQICALEGIADTAKIALRLLIKHGSASLIERAQEANDWLRLPLAQRVKDPEPWLNLFLVREIRGGIRPMRKNFPSNTLCEQLVADDAVLLRGLIEDESARLMGLFSERTHLLATQASLRLARIAGSFAASYESEKQRQHALDYNDLILKSRALLCDSSAAAWVRFRLDGGLHHLLIDEAQDTNPEQWQVVKALIEEFYAGQSAHEDRGGKPRTFFAVGDTKQSIFSFQGANVASTNQFLTQLGAEVQAKGLGWQNLSLSRSYRSAPAVLRLVDAVFAVQSQGADFENLQHFAERDLAAGVVEIAPVVAKPSRAEAEAVADGLSPNQQLVEHLAERIHGWLNPPQPVGPGDEAWLESESRPVRASDIMILLQSRKPFMALLASALRARQVQVAQADRTTLASRPIVADLCVLGETLLNRDDNLALAIALKSPFCGLTDSDLLELVRSARARGQTHKERGTLNRGALWLALENSSAPRCQVAADRLRRWRGVSARARIHDLFEQILAEVGRAHITAVLGDSAEEDLQRFLSAALLWEEKTQGAGLLRFLHGLAQDTSEQSSDAERSENAVRILTVHSAKGLEAPIVILPQTIRTARGQGGETILWLQQAETGKAFPLWFVRSGDVPEEVLNHSFVRQAQATEQGERERLLYVALTRARDRLLIYGVAGKVAKDPDGRDGWSQGDDAPVSWYERIWDGAERLQQELAKHGGKGGQVGQGGKGGQGARVQVEEVAEAVPWSKSPVLRFVSRQEGEQTGKQGEKQSGKQGGEQGKQEAEQTGKQESRQAAEAQGQTETRGQVLAGALPAWHDAKVSPDPGGGVQVIAASSLSLSGGVLAADSARQRSGVQGGLEGTPEGTGKGTGLGTEKDRGEGRLKDAPEGTERDAESDSAESLSKGQGQEQAAPVLAPAMRGTLIHALLQYLPPVAVERRKERGAAWLAQQLAKANLPQEALREVQDEILARALAVLDDSAIVPLFAGLGLAEVPLIGVLPRSRADGGEDGVAPLFINGRVDRLVIGDEKVIVVDYKSDRNPPSTAAEVGRKYLAQMAAYRSLLQSLYPNRVVEAGLLWTETPRWMVLPQDLLDEALPRLASAEEIEAEAETAA